MIIITLVDWLILFWNLADRTKAKSILGEERVIGQIKRFFTDF